MENPIPTIVSDIRHAIANYSTHTPAQTLDLLERAASTIEAMRSEFDALRKSSERVQIELEADLGRICGAPSPGWSSSIVGDKTLWTKDFGAYTVTAVRCGDFCFRLDFPNPAPDIDWSSKTLMYDHGPCCTFGTGLRELMESADDDVHLNGLADAGAAEGGADLGFTFDGMTWILTGRDVLRDDPACRRHIVFRVFKAGQLHDHGGSGWCVLAHLSDGSPIKEWITIHAVCPRTAMRAAKREASNLKWGWGKE